MQFLNKTEHREFHKTNKHATRCHSEMDHLDIKSYGSRSAITTNSQIKEENKVKKKKTREEEELIALPAAAAAALTA